MLLNILISILVAFTSVEELEAPFEDFTERTACTASNQCFSYEYCHAKKGCVDAAREPCVSIGDCVAGESCRLDQDPHRCQ